MVIGEMHYAAVAVSELGGSPTAADVASKLGWYLYRAPGGVDGVPDVPRAETALLAAHEHNLLEFSLTP
jgi:hypothetical protein